MGMRRECNSTVECSFCTGPCPFEADSNPELQTVIRNGTPHLCDGTGDMPGTTEDDSDDNLPDIVDPTTVEGYADEEEDEG